MIFRNILVTGSSGMIGTRLCEKLLEKNFNVIGVDLKENKWNKLVDKITIREDLRKKESLQKIPESIDLIIHLAANARVRDLIIKPSLALDNLTILFNVLEYSRLRKIKRFIFASSREVYGNLAKASSSEENVGINFCENPYASSKAGGESLISAYRKCYDIDHVICRFSNVYGMYDKSDRVIPIFIKNCLNGEDLTVFGQDKLLDFLYIDDSIQGILNCMEKFDSVKNSAFNIASGKSKSIIDIALLIKSMTDKKIKIGVRPNRLGDVENYMANILRAKQRLEYYPRTDLEEGIKKTIEWYKNFYKGES